MLYPVITKGNLKELYEIKNLSMMQISKELDCSHHKVAYWMSQYNIPRRHRSKALYLMHNPNGDPFKIKLPENSKEKILYGLGIGLYWGEGTRSSRNAVRLGNSDPGVIKVFLEFLEKLCGVDIDSVKFGLQIFSDVDSKEALDFWTENLKIPASQFYKPIITRSGAIGTYRVKNKYGVVTINFGNTKLRDILVKKISELQAVPR